MPTFNNAEFSKVATMAARAEKAGEAKIAALVAMVETITKPEDYKAARHAYIAARLAVFEGADIGKIYDTKGSGGFPDATGDSRGPGGAGFDRIRVLRPHAPRGSACPR